MSLYVELLGPASIRHDGGWLEPPAGKTSALLYYLAYQGRWVSRDELLFLLWPDLPESSARRNLRRLLTSIRSQPHTEELEAEPSRLRWQVPTDVADFKRAITEGSSAKAVQYYTGELLQGFKPHGMPEFDSWLELERQALHDNYRQVALAFSKELEINERLPEAASVLSRVRNFDSLDEEVLRRQLLCLYLSEQRSKALKVFEEFKETLEADLSVQPEEATLDLAERIRNQETIETAAPAEKSTREEHNLQLQPTPFVGRSAELLALAEQLKGPGCRLLTLVGPGGIGKTRLALELARGQLGNFAHGVYFVALAAASSPEATLFSVADVLNIPLIGSRNPKDQLLQVLRDKEMLLLVDNLEHLLEGVSWYAELLAEAPGIKLLATSRERLNLRGERVVDLAGLPVPKDAVEDIMSFDAVRLFVERAHNVRSDFVLDEMNSQAVARICQLVEGLPLALELAAIWVRGLPLVDIVVGLEEGIELLASSSRDVPERHRSIRAVFERSWKLLSGEERTVMRKLSVFRGGFRSEAANQVAGAALGMLAGLVDKSLLRLMPSGRYDIHPLIHQYAQEQLAEDPEELVETRARHGEYHLALAKQLREKSWVRASEVQATFGEDVENIRAAWRRAVAEEQLEALELMSEPLGWWYRRVNRLLEAREDFTLAIAALNEADPRHHKALGTVHALNCAICFHLGRADEAERSARLAIKLLSPLGETQGILSGLQVLGYMALREGGFTSAQEFFGEHLSLANTLNGLDHFNALARSLFDLANVAVATGNYHEAEERYLEGLVAAREAGNSRWASDILRLLGILYLKVGRLDEAASYLDQSRALADLADSSRNISLYTDLARVALARGAFHEAWSLCQEALENVKSPGTHVAEIMLFSVMGQTAAVLGHSHEAWKYLVEGVRFGWQMGLTDALLEVLVYLSEFAADQGHTEEAFTWASVVLKHKAAPYFTKEDARRLLETLDEQLSPQERSRLLERANHIDLSLMIDKIPDVLHGTS